MSTDDERPSQRAARPLPPRLDPRLGRDRTGSTAVRPAGSGSRGTRLAWAARVTAGVLSLILLGTSGWGWYLGRVAEAAVNRTDAIPGSGNSGSGGAPAAMNCCWSATTAEPVSPRSRKTSCTRGAAPASTPTR